MVPLSELSTLRSPSRVWGNQVEVTCTEAFALSVEPSPKRAAAREK
jgi:hypothetical protein